jgi:hypothetical protein
VTQQPQFCQAGRPVDVLPDELRLVAGQPTSNRWGFARMLKFFTRRGRFLEGAGMSERGERDKLWEAERDGSGGRLWSAFDAGGLGLLDVLPTSWSSFARGCSKTTWLACSAHWHPPSCISDGQELAA